ncbi:MAG: preprotein translocase subunit SecG [Synechococcales cyanobacterium RM1_1_8]|nr:preprotein translocase subunit SecG [Synechococcales cyanobacterium RM1_1_8]
MALTKILGIVWTASAVGMVIIILLHSPKGDGIGGIGGQAQLFNSSKSAETALNRAAWLLFIVFIGLTTVLSAGWLDAPVQ